MSTVSLVEGLRPFEFIVDVLLGGIGGPFFKRGHAANTFGTKTRGVNTIVAISGGLVVPWDPNSADVPTKTAVGVAGYAINGTYTEATVPDSYLGAVPCRVRLDRMNYPLAGTSAGDLAATAALTALGYNVLD